MLTFGEYPLNTSPFVLGMKISEAPNRVQVSDATRAAAADRHSVAPADNGTGAAALSLGRGLPRALPVFRFKRPRICPFRSGMGKIIDLKIKDPFIFCDPDQL